MILPKAVRTPPLSTTSVSPPVIDDEMERRVALYSRETPHLESEFDAIYIPVRRFARLFARTEHEAQDLAHEALTKVWRTVQANGVEIRTTLLGYVKGTVVTIWKKRRNSPQLPESLDRLLEQGIQPAANPQPFHHEFLSLVEWLRSEMVRNHAQVYLLRAVYLMTIAEIAEVLHRDRGTVTDHLAKAETFLQAHRARIQFVLDGIAQERRSDQ